MFPWTSSPDSSPWAFPLLCFAATRHFPCSQFVVGGIVRGKMSGGNIPWGICDVLHPLLFPFGLSAITKGDTLSYSECFPVLTTVSSAQIGIGSCTGGRDVDKCVERFNRSTRTGKACNRKHNSSHRRDLAHWAAVCCIYAAPPHYLIALNVTVHTQPRFYICLFRPYEDFCFWINNFIAMQTSNKRRPHSCRAAISTQHSGTAALSAGITKYCPTVNFVFTLYTLI